MKLNRNFYSNIAYGLLTFFFTLIIIYTFKFKMRVIQNLNFRDKINLNSNLENSNNKPFVEGFGQRNERLFKKDDDVFTLIERKLKGLTEDDKVIFHDIQIVKAVSNGIWITGLEEESKIITVGQGFVEYGETVSPVYKTDYKTEPQSEQEIEPQASLAETGQE